MRSRTSPHTAAGRTCCPRADRGETAPSAERRRAEDREQGLGLVEPFLVFLFRDRVPDETAAGPCVDSPAASDERADCDVEVHVAVEPDIADRAAIDATALGLEGVDDLHRAYLRRAGDRAARERGAHEIERVSGRAQPPDDRADEMMDVREALDVEQLLDGDAAGFADLAEIVAQEIDDHHVLRAILRARAKLGRERRVAHGIRGARPRALDRLRLDVPAGDPEEAL